MLAANRPSQRYSSCSRPSRSMRETSTTLQASDFPAAIARFAGSATVRPDYCLIESPQSATDVEASFKDIPHPATIIRCQRGLANHDCEVARFARHLACNSRSSVDKTG
jgi:hypothetical protein